MKDIKWINGTTQQIKPEVLIEVRGPIMLINKDPRIRAIAIVEDNNPLISGADISDK